MITSDNEIIYDEQISPLMAKIIAICKQHKIPMVATFNYAPEQACTTSLPQQSLYGEEDDDGKQLARVADLIRNPSRGSFAAFTIMTTHREEIK